MAEINSDNGKLHPQEASKSDILERYELKEIAFNRLSSSFHHLAGCQPLETSLRDFIEVCARWCNGFPLVGDPPDQVLLFSVLAHNIYARSAYDIAAEVCAVHLGCYCFKDCGAAQSFCNNLRVVVKDQFKIDLQICCYDDGVYARRCLGETESENLSRLEDLRRLPIDYMDDI